MADQIKTGAGRRQSVRGTDRVLFSWEEIEPEAYRKLVEDYKKGISIYNQSGLVEIQKFIGARKALERLKQRDNDLGTVLQLLDTKINYVLQKLSNQETPLDKQKLQDVNFSDRGIAFFSDTKMDRGQPLAFHITLLPDYIYVYCIGKVIACKDVNSKESDQPYRISVEFTLIMDDDREKLIQHNFKQQSLALRNRRKNQ